MIYGVNSLPTETIADGNDCRRKRLPTETIADENSLRGKLFTECIDPPIAAIVAIVAIDERGMAF